MPYTAEHKQATRERIVECARRLFNRRGYSDVSIDEVMAAAGLTRGGFYNHFKTKEDLFAEAIITYAKNCPADRWQDVAVDFSAPRQVIARQLVDAYLSQSHLADIDGHCPMIALPSDVARAGPAIRRSYQTLFEGMVDIFEQSVGPGTTHDRRQRALALAATCIGGMVLARTFDDGELAEDVRAAARSLAMDCLAQREAAE